MINSKNIIENNIAAELYNNDILDAVDTLDKHINTIHKKQILTNHRVPLI